MSEHEQTIIDELCKKFDDKYKAMVKLLSITGIALFGSLLAIGAVQLKDVARIDRQQEINTEAIKYIVENSVSQKAIDLLIVSFENQTSVIENYLPGDIQGAMKEFNRVSSTLRSNVMMFNSSLSTRGGTTGNGGQE
jgi:hypothetical protein